MATWKAGDIFCKFKIIVCLRLDKPGFTVDLNCLTMATMMMTISNVLLNTFRWMDAVGVHRRNQ
jgi:hypothetical protein